MSMFDDAIPYRLVSFLRVCDCQVVGKRIAVTWSKFNSFTDLLNELNSYWGHKFPFHAKARFVYNFDGYEINYVDQFTEHVVYLCSAFPLDYDTFCHLWRGISPLEIDQEKNPSYLKFNQLFRTRNYFDDECYDHLVEYNFEDEEEEIDEFDEDVLEKYAICRRLGGGAFGSVHEAIHKSSGDRVAIKVIKDLAEDGERALVEASLMRKCKHENIVDLLDLFETPNQLCLVLELCEDGDIFTLAEVEGQIEESKTQILIKDILSGLAYLHSLNVVHRDIKPENTFFVKRPDGSISAKIGDFGEAVEISQPIFDLTGTLVYMAPEMWLGSGYGKKIDVWATGIMTYFLLCGHILFLGETEGETQNAIIYDKVDFNKPQWIELGISHEAEKFLKCILRKSPRSRPSSNKALRHQWLNPEIPQKCTGCH